MTATTELLRGSTLFSTLPDSELERIEPGLREETYAKGERVIAEGEKGDTAYLIASGQADVVTRNLIGEEITLRTFGRGDIFGEVALVEADGTRTATVRASADLDVRVLDRATFKSLEQGNPQFADAVRKRVDMLSLDRFLKKASPFARLRQEALDRIIGELVSVPVRAGQAVVTEGEEGDRFYLVRSGTFEVVQGGKRIATYASGDVFGEVALLTGGPRIATVRALEAGEVLALSKADFDAVVKEQGAFGRQLLALGRVRFRATTGQNLMLPDPLTTLMPYLQRGSRNKYWAFVLGGVAGFAVFAFASFALGIGWAMWTTLILGAFLTPVLYLLYLVEADILQARPWAIAQVFIVAAILGIPVTGGLQALVDVNWYSAQGAFAIAAIEEPVKFLAVFLILRRRTDRFRMDGVIFGAAAGIGFSAFESLLFGLGYLDAPSQLLQALVVRSVLTPLAQGTWTAIVCGVVWGEKTRGRLRDRRVLAAFVAAVGLHFLWDWQPFGQSVTVGGLLYFPWYQNLAWFLFIAVIGIVVLRVLVNRAAQEEVAQIVRLNPDLADQAGSRIGARGLRCTRCEQVAPAGAQYCVRCGAALRAVTAIVPVSSHGSAT